MIDPMAELLGLKLEKWEDEIGDDEKEAQDEEMLYMLVSCKFLDPSMAAKSKLFDISTLSLLDGRHVVFGKVISVMDVVYKTILGATMANLRTMDEEPTTTCGRN
ncbi:hypothetical protein G4B88_027797 [Cannabis sativa]|uniref:PPIase cyclophilin-type domain-containing protein n=1 Tax=Cannabis sativa TaxID=3483 RepID=A0A7J6DMN7_CANSA|nr:hypothetical protein G4B88_027797 [Cannabis sativa]